MKNLQTTKNIVFNVIKTINSIIFPLVTIPYINRVLGPINNGKINFGNSIISYFSIIAVFGTYIYGIRECSKHVKDKDKLNVISSEIYTISIISTCFSLILLFSLLLFRNNFFEYRTIILIQSLQIVLSIIGTDWINVAENDFAYITIRTTIFQLLAIILMFVFVKNENDCIIYVLISSLVVNGHYFVNIWYRRKYCDISFKLSKDLVKHIKPLFYLFILLFSQTIYSNIGTTILGLTNGDYEVGIFSLSFKVYNLINQVLSSAFIVFLSQLSYSFEKKDYDSINSNLRYCLNVVITIGLPSIVGMVMISDEIIYLLGGSAYLSASSSLKILSISLLFSLLGGFISNGILLPNGKDFINLIGSILCAIVNLLFNIIFTPKYGVISVAISILITQIFGFIYSCLFVDKNIKISDKKNLIIIPLIECIAIIIISMIIRQIIANKIIILLLTILLCVFVYIILLTISKNEFLSDLLSIIKKKKQVR